MAGWREGRAHHLPMAALLLCWACSSLVAICGKNISAQSKNSITATILGGESANITEFPWHVGVLHKGTHICGGSILSEWWILSASHCFINTNLSNVAIVHGTDDLEGNHVKSVGVDKIIIHPDYDSEIHNHDIALVLLKLPLTLDVTTMPIHLSEVTDLKAWTSCWVTGWGIINLDLMKTPNLQKVEVDLVPWEKCFHIFSLFTTNMICAGNSEDGKDACQGDSGGPLVCLKKKEKRMKKKSRWYQLGIVSWGIKCGKKELPGVYTKVSNYLLWMNSETARAAKPYRHEPDCGQRWLISPWAILFLYFVVLLLFW